MPKSRGVRRAEQLHSQAQAKAKPKLGRPAIGTLPGGGAAPRGGREGKRGPPESRTSPSADSVSKPVALTAQKPLIDLQAPERAREIARLEARKSLQSLVRKCRAHTEAAVDVLVDVMQKSSHPPSRVAAAKAIIEFGNGKAPETIRLENLYTPDQLKLMAEEIALKRLREGSIDGGKLGEK